MNAQNDFDRKSSSFMGFGEGAGSDTENIQTGVRTSKNILKFTTINVDYGFVVDRDRLFRNL